MILQALKANNKTIQSVMIEENVLFDISKEQQIPLKVMKHYGYSGCHAPENMLSKNDSYYKGSQRKSCIIRQKCKFRDLGA